MSSWLSLVNDLLQSRRGRLVLFTALYASEGAPIGFIWWALPTLLAFEGVAVDRITGLLAVLVLFWALKFLWAPLVDTLRSERFGFREWIIAAQSMMGVALLPLLWVEPSDGVGLIGALLLAHALAATIQDVAIDALAVNVVPSRERGALNGSMQVGMLLGRSLFGGGALLVASRWGMRWIVAALIVTIWSSLALLLLSRGGRALNAERHETSPAGEREAHSLGGPNDRVAGSTVGFGQRNHRERLEGTFARSPSVAGAFGSLLAEALRRRSTWIGLAFALTSAAAFETAGALAGPFLKERGASKEAIGLFFGLPAVIATMAGAWAGGKISDRSSRAGSIAVFLAGFVSMVLALALVDAWTPPGRGVGLSVGILTGMYLFIGLFTAASYALFMDLTDPRLGATQFSAFMSATNGCEAWTVWAGGRIVAGAGYPAAFAAMSLVSLLSLPLLVPLARHRKVDEHS